MQRITIGLDIAKSVFQVHGEDASGQVVVQKRLRRSQVLPFFAGLEPALVGIEACGSAHYWARELRALGHEARLIPAAYVKPFVRRNKNDARDAAAVCTAVGRPDMRFVAIKSAESQASRGLERSRELLLKQHTQLMNSVRSQLAEFGIIAAQGRRGFAQLSELVAAGDERIPELLLPVLRLLLQQIDQLRIAGAAIEAKIMAVAKADPTMRRLATIPGVGGLTAHAIVTAIGDGKQFASSRDFAAWCGLTPRGASSGLKRRQGGISRQGDIRLRKLLALGASTVMRNARSRADRATEWQRGILARRPVKVAVLAQAAKTARIAWAMLTAGTTFRQPAGAAQPQPVERRARAVKPAPRRLRRWPPARLDRAGARRSRHRRSGRRNRRGRTKKQSHPQPTGKRDVTLANRNRRPQLQSITPSGDPARQPQGAPSSDGKMVRTWVGTLRSVIAPHKRAAMLGARSA
jgi:transposase